MSEITLANLADVATNMMFDGIQLPPMRVRCGRAAYAELKRLATEEDEDLRKRPNCQPWARLGAIPVCVEDDWPAGHWILEGKDHDILATGEVKP